MVAHFSFKRKGTCRCSILTGILQDWPLNSIVQCCHTSSNLVALPHCPSQPASHPATRWSDSRLDAKEWAIERCVDERRTRDGWGTEIVWAGQYMAALGRIWKSSYIAMVRGRSLHCGIRYLTRRLGQGRAVTDGISESNDTAAQMVVQLRSPDDIDSQS